MLRRNLRESLLIVVTFLLLSTYIFRLTQTVFKEKLEINTNTKNSETKPNNKLKLKEHRRVNKTDPNFGRLLFEDILTLNKDVVKLYKKQNPTSIISPKDILDQLKRKYKSLVSEIHSWTKHAKYINNDIDDQSFSLSANATKQLWYHYEVINKRTENCNEYFNSLPILMMHDEVLEYEKHAIETPFPLAFSHMLHKDVAIFELFLALYFRPNNFHCVHVDRKAPDRIRRTVEKLVRCYKTKANYGVVYVVPQNESISVKWGEMSVLDADMKCQSKLLQFNKVHKVQWKYVSSVAGSELPMVTYATFHNKISTNLENESSSVESFDTPEPNRWRFDTKEKFAIKEIENDVETVWYEIPNVVLSNPGEKNFTRSLKFKIFKGIKNVILSTRDTEFLINSQMSRQLYAWFKDTDFPEEHFLPTLIRITINPHTLSIRQNQSSEFIYQDIGGLTYTEGNTLNGLCPRYTTWMKRYDCVNNIGCFGKCLNSICNLHTLDLEKISDVESECLILNKFNVDVDPSAVSFQLLNVLQKTIIESNNAFKNWEILFDKIVNMKFLKLY